MPGASPARWLTLLLVDAVPVLEFLVPQALSYAIALHKAKCAEFRPRPSSSCHSCLGRYIPRRKEAGNVQMLRQHGVLTLLSEKIQPICTPVRKVWLATVCRAGKWGPYSPRLYSPVRIAEVRSRSSPACLRSLFRRRPTFRLG